jgi:hypothetical protein
LKWWYDLFHLKYLMIVKLFISLIYFIDISNIFLDYIMHYIPTHIYILFFHCQCIEF